MDTMLLGGMTRALQTAIMAAPTLLVGLFVAALFRYFLGTDGIRRLFGGESLRSLPQSWAIGMLLPVCSVGVLPILREMHRAKLRPGALTAFALAAPLFNPLSLLYGLTLSRPAVILGFLFGSLVVVTALGLFWDRLIKSVSDDSSATPNAADAKEVSYGIKRIVACVVLMARELFGPTGLLMLVAMLGIFLLGCILPHGALQTSVEQNDPTAPLTMTAVGLLIYSTPMLIMSQLGMMFAHGNSPGAAFCLLILGAGLNLATIVWVAFTYGWKQTIAWLAGLVLIVLACAYAVDKPLIPRGVEPAGHTHAFDIYTNPFHRSQPIEFAAIKNVLSETSDFATDTSLKAIALLVLLGITLTIMGKDNRLEKWVFAREANAENSLGMDRIVSPTIVGVTCLIGLVGLSVVGCYAYYPKPTEVLKQMQTAKGEVLGAALSDDIEVALAWIPIWEDWSRKLEVGTYIREFELRPYQRMQTFLLRKQLELLEHELEHHAHEHEHAHDHDSQDSHPTDHAGHDEIHALIQRLSATSLRVSECYRN